MRKPETPLERAIAEARQQLARKSGSEIYGQNGKRWERAALVTKRCLRTLVTAVESRILRKREEGRGDANS